MLSAVTELWRQKAGCVAGDCREGWEKAETANSQALAQVARDRAEPKSLMRRILSLSPLVPRML